MARPAAVLLLAAALTLSLLTGCAGWNRPGIDDMAEDFFAALDARDPEALQSLFAPSVLSADPRLPESIEALLTLYPNYFLKSLFYNKHLNHSLYYLCGKCVCFCVNV